MTISIRDAQPADIKFVVSSWVAATRHLPRKTPIPDDAWWPTMYPLIERQLQRSDVRTLVAADPDSADHVADLFGFIVAIPRVSPAVVMFCYVKEAYRRAGIGRRLMFAMGIDPSKRFDYTTHVPLLFSLTDKIPLAKQRCEAAMYPPRRTA